MILCSLAAIVLPLSAQVADPDVEALLAKMRMMYSAPQTARLEVLVKQSVEGGFAEYTVNFDYAKPNRARVEVIRNDSKEFESVSDGKKIAILNPDGTARETKDWDFQAMGDVVPANLETISFYDWKRQLSTDPGANMHDSVLRVTKDELWNGQTWMILDEVAEDVGIIVKYFIDKNTSLIWRTLVRRIDGNRLVQDCQVITMERGLAIDARRFIVPGS